MRIELYDDLVGRRGDPLGILLGVGGAAFLAQSGYFVLDFWQVYARYQLVDPGTTPGLIAFHAMTVGTSLFPFEWTNRYKLSLEGGMPFSAINQTLVAPNGAIGWLPADEGNQYYLRFQLQFGL